MADPGDTAGSRTVDTPTQTALMLVAQLMDRYASATGEPFKNHPLHQHARTIRGAFEEVPPVRSRRDLRVRVSVGQGNWAVIPWIAVLHTRETTTTKNGVYLIVLFRADMAGFYLTLNQGITQPMDHMGRAAARTALERRCTAIRNRFPNLAAGGFAADGRIELADERGSTGYEKATIAHRYFGRAELVERAPDFQEALAALLEAYDQYVTTPILLDVRTETDAENSWR